MKLERINTNLQREISHILAEEVKDKDIEFVTITAVEVTNDLSVAKIYVTILNDGKRDQTMEALAKAKGFVRSQLFDRVEMRKIPDLRFIYDESVARGQRIENLIKEAQ